MTQDTDDLYAELEADAELEAAQEIARSEDAPQTVRDVAEALIDAKKRLDQVKAEQSDIQAEYDRLRKIDMPRAMETAKIKNFTTESGVRVALRTEHYAGVKKEFEDKLFAWLRDTGNGSLIKETVHHKTLSSFARELLAESGPTALPEFVSVHSEVVATLTRVKRVDVDELD